MRYFSFFFFFSIFFSCYFFFLSALSLFSLSLSLPSSFSTIQRRDNTEGAISRSIPCHCLFLPSNTRGKSFLKWPWEGNVDACDDNAIIWKDCLKSGTQENHDDFCETTTTQSKNDLLSLKKRISSVKLYELSCSRILSRSDARMEKRGWTLCGFFQELVIYCCLSDLLNYFSQSREEETYEYNFCKEVEEFRGTRQRTGAS